MDDSVDRLVFGPDAVSQDTLSARLGILMPATWCSNLQRTNVFSPDNDMTLSLLSDSSCSVDNSPSSLSSMSPSSSPVSFSACPSVNTIPEKRRIRSRKKACYKHVPHCLKPPHLVAKRNARERKRVQAVNSAFSKLRKHVPYEPRHKRLSKVKTLRVAIEYIRRLQELIYVHDRQLQRDESIAEESCRVPGRDSKQREHPGSEAEVRRRCFENCRQKGSPLIGSVSRRRAKISDVHPGPFHGQANEVYDVRSLGQTVAAQQEHVSALDLKRQDGRVVSACAAARQPCHQQTFRPLLTTTDVVRSDNCNGSQGVLYNARYYQNNPSNVASVFQIEAGKMSDTNSHCAEARHFPVADDSLYDGYDTGHAFTSFPEQFQEGAGFPIDGQYTKRFPFDTREADQSCSKGARRLRDSGFSSTMLEPGFVLDENCGIT